MFSNAMAAQDSPLPNGWRLPTAKEISQKWRAVDKKDHFSQAEGDFDGDHQSDRAMILISADNKKAGIWVWLSSKNKFFDLEAGSTNEILNRRSISKVKPFSGETACGRGAWECGKDEPAKISTTTDSISIGIPEASETYYIWQSKEGRFQIIPMSD